MCPCNLDGGKALKAIVNKKHIYMTHIKEGFSYKERDLRSYHKTTYMTFDSFIFEEILAPFMKTFEPEIMVSFLKKYM